MDQKKRMSGTKYLLRRARTKTCVRLRPRGTAHFVWPTAHFFWPAAKKCEAQKSEKKGGSKPHIDSGTWWARWNFGENNAPSHHRTPNAPADHAAMPPALVGWCHTGVFVLHNRPICQPSRSSTTNVHAHMSRSRETGGGKLPNTDCQGTNRFT